MGRKGGERTGDRDKREKRRRRRSRNARGGKGRKAVTLKREGQKMHLSPLVTGLGHHGHLGDGGMEVQGILNLSSNGREGGMRGGRRVSREERMRGNRDGYI